MNTYQLVIDSLDLNARDNQEKLFNDMSNSLLNNDVFFGQASTGIGKTLSTACAAIDVLEKDSENNPRIIIASQTIALCREYQALFDKIGVDTKILLSYRNFFCQKRLSLLEKDFSLYPEKLNQIRLMQHWDGTIDQYILEFGELPLNLTQEQVAQSSSSISESYQAERNEAISSSIVITTHAMIAADIMHMGKILNPKERKTYLIIDEADAFVDYLQDFQKRNFNIVRELSHISQLVSQNGRDCIVDIITELKSNLTDKVQFNKKSKDKAVLSLEAISAILSKSKKRNLCESDNIYYQEFTAYLQQVIREIKEKLFVTACLTAVRKEPTIAIFNPYFSRVFSYYVREMNISLAIISGTLSVSQDIDEGTEWIKRELNFESSDIKSFEYTPDPFGKLKINIHHSSEALYTADELDDSQVTLSEFWLDDISNKIKALSGKTLVVTSSFKEAELIGQRIGEKAIVHESGTKISVAKEHFLSKEGDCILISPSATTGVNFTIDNRSILTNIVITRLGFEPRNEILSSLTESEEFSASKISMLRQKEYHSATNKVIRRGIQIIGRGIRHKDDMVNLYIYDNRFPFFEQINSRYTMLKSIIPARFAKEYRNANTQKPIKESASKKQSGSTNIDFSFIC